MQLAVVSILVALLPVHASPMGPKITRQDPSQQQEPAIHVRKQADAKVDAKDDSCIDDPKWADQDGDSCAEYAKQIQNNDISQTEACNYLDGAAKTHCPATCGLCEQQQPGIIQSLVASLVSAGSAPEVNPNPTVRLETAKHPEVEAPSKSLDTSKGCIDDPDWVDADGDSCAVYADHILSKQLTQDEACMYGTADARDHCRVTCGTCLNDPSSPAKKETPSAEEHASAPLPSPYRAPVSPKMVPSISVAAPAPAPIKDECMDDPEWSDQDGDSCAMYADKIKAGEFSLEEACSYGAEEGKKHCPVTCHTCPQKAEVFSASATVAKQEASIALPTIAKKEACIDDPDWVDQDGDGCVAYATAIKVGSMSQEEACGYSDSKAKKHCLVTCNVCPVTEHIPVHHNLLAHPVGPKMALQDPNASVMKKGACIDDPDWADQDGDNCATYAQAILEEKFTQVEACASYGGKAKQHCLVTCSTCPRSHSRQQNLLHHPPSASTEASEAVQFV